MCVCVCMCMYVALLRLPLCGMWHVVAVPLRGVMLPPARRGACASAYVERVAAVCVRLATDSAYLQHR